MGGRLSFRLLGPLAVHGTNGEVKLSGKRQNILLTMLLIENDRVIEAPRLIQAIWNDSPPATARSQIRICVSSLRRQFAAGGVAASIETHKTGYRLRAPAEEIDLHLFGELLARTRAQARTADRESTVRMFREALGLWRGPVGAGLDSPLLEGITLKFHEDRYSALEECFELELELGNHRKILGELARHVAEHPFRETLAAQLMLALFHSGRTADALALFRKTRRMFCDELGIEPGERLRSIERFIFDGTAAGPLPKASARVSHHHFGRPGEAFPALPPQDRIALLEKEIALLREESLRSVRSRS
ncbi:AfsR/SARP family transcriptional regulator [Streptomyces verrucosisporus]|uniref:AfsR/SARP family transcriptional regulator n=1 Tax=Streptomyces verrucosisporus TaxID=1695161 RepID=UPI0019D0DC36|nr:AfsR/SARP family transcriptional regulator [Streptomyces verrucosisporus]MBN3930681.1 AfsR/SARP family transcriptional regulator [Streptomyces verrucosisporus]